MAYIEGVDGPPINPSTINSVNQANAGSKAPEDIAKKVIDSGDGSDQAAALAQELGDASANERADIVNEVIAQDPYALDTWLNPAQINAWVDSGELGSAERANLAEGIAAAYNSGDGSAFEAETGGIYDDSVGLDRTLIDFFGPGASNTHVDFAQDVDAFLEFFGSSDGPEVAQFRLNYAEHLTNTYVLSGNYTGTAEAAAANLATALLTSDPTRPSLAATFFATATDANGELLFSDANPSATDAFDADFDAFLKAAAEGSDWLNQAAIEHTIETYGIEGVNAADIALEDPIVALTSSLTDRPAQLSGGYYAGGVHDYDTIRTSQDRLALSLIGTTGSSAELFTDGHFGQQRLEALTDVFIRFDGLILDQLTDPGSFTELETSGGLEQISNSGLGSFFKLALFNQDLSNHAELQDTVLDYAAELHDTIRAPGNNTTAGERLVVLSAAFVDGLQQNYQDYVDDIEAQRELVGFGIDLALGLLPVDLPTNKVKEFAADLFGDGVIGDAIKDLSGDLVDQATGRLTDEAKEAILDSIGDEDIAALVEDAEYGNFLLDQTIGVYEQLLRAEDELEPTGTGGNIDEVEELEYKDIKTLFRIVTGELQN